MLACSASHGFMAKFGLFLTTRAKMCSSTSYFLLFNNRPATMTFLSRPAIDFQMLGEIPFPTAGINVIIESCAAIFNGFSNNLLD